MKLITDADTESTIGYISDCVIFGFDKANRPVEIGRFTEGMDAVKVIKEWQAKKSKR